MSVPFTWNTTFPQSQETNYRFETSLVPVSNARNSSINPFVSFLSLMKDIFNSVCECKMKNNTGFVYNRIAEVARMNSWNKSDPYVILNCFMNECKLYRPTEHMIISIARELFDRSNPNFKYLETHHLNKILEIRDVETLILFFYFLLEKSPRWNPFEINGNGMFNHGNKSQFECIGNQTNGFFRSGLDRSQMLSAIRSDLMNLVNSTQPICRNSLFSNDPLNKLQTKRKLPFPYY